MNKLWRDHSLTIVSAGIGLAFLIASIPLAEGTWFDIIVGLGHGCVTVAAVQFLAGWFRERNKPED